MSPISFRRRFSVGSARLPAAVLALGLVPGLAAARPQEAVLHGTPAYVRTARDLGAANPGQTIEVVVWLNVHDRDQMDALARDLYRPGSPNYRHWLTPADLAARFAPSAAEAQTVQAFLAASNLQVVRVGNDNFFVRARGQIADVEKAFQVSLHKYQVRGKTLRANTSDPKIAGAAAPLVRAVEGLDSGTYEQHVLVHGASGAIGAPGQTRALTAADPGFFSTACFTAGRETLSTNNNGALTTATLTGNQLNLATATSAGCGYTPASLYAAYDLGPLYAEGFTGKGQTIAIVDWCGSSTVESDTNAFSRRFGLPLLNKSNFNIIYTPTNSDCIGVDQVEINMDVEWAHAFAPGANINLIVPPSASFADTDEALFETVNKGLGNSISGSFGSVELVTPTSVLETENLIAQMAAMQGMSTNFSSGDGGDDGAGTQSVNAPADAPWATGVGGVSLALTNTNSIAWQSGWGTTLTLVDQAGFIFDPPFQASFAGGSGGGVSNCVYFSSTEQCTGGFAKPAFQKGLPGKQRLVPDISWLADPYTGAVIAITVPGQSPARVWQTVGGTSLAAPMFSALWAIANEEAGMPLGQAAQYLYSMPAGAITDVVPYAGSHNVVETVTDANGTTKYKPREVIGSSTPALGRYFSTAYWNVFSNGNVEIVSFGTDCSPALYGDDTPCSSPQALRTKLGWDNVTGMGVPDGRIFADAFRSSFVSPETP